jgi:AmmeMemoRadiSam system protein A
VDKKAQENSLLLARTALTRYLSTGQIIDAPNVAPFNQEAACFVTLHTKENHALRGCIGSLQAHRSLGKDIVHNALSAAVKDPRFSPLSIEELDGIEIEISVLTEPKPFIYQTVEDLLTLLRPNEDGVVIEYEGHRATFLPTVWEEIPDPAQFMGHLCLKAGLEANFFLTCKLNVKLYSSEVFKEEA